MFRATALVYSSHNRSEEIHRWWIVERALQSLNNKTVLYLPMSMGSQDSQDYSWGTFRWYFNQYKKWGLEPYNFFWNEHLSKEDVATFFDLLENCEVVILGGGSSITGMERYKALGERFYGNWNLFGEILADRQAQGKLTVGFSAGADQLCEYMMGAIESGYKYASGFGLAHNVMTTLHHEWGREGSMINAARNFSHCMVFGLPNDSGLAVSQGYLHSGNIWQIIEFIVDKTWDIPQEAFHIKTRQGMNVEHYYADGRHWSFAGGDRLIRVMSQDNQYLGAWIAPKYEHGLTDYWSQKPSGYGSIEHILASH